MQLQIKKKSGPGFALEGSEFHKVRIRAEFAINFSQVTANFKLSFKLCT